jgi:TorA maturation chaperone TorD
VGATASPSERTRAPRIEDAFSNFVFMHEMGHLWYLDWTPAKEVARTDFATSYGLIAALMYSHRSDANLRRIWTRLQASEDRIDASTERIGLVEELVATAAAVEAIASQTGPGERWAECVDEMEVFVEEVLKAEESRLPGFTDLFPTARSLIREIRGNPAVVAAVVPLLQRVGVGSNPAPDETATTLESLWHLLQGATSADEKLRRLRQLTAQHDHEWEGALVRQIENMVENDSDRDTMNVHNFARRLWLISKGEPENPIDRSPAEVAVSIVAKLRRTIARGDRIGPGSTLIIQPTTLGPGGPGRLSVSWWSDTIENEDLKADHIKVAIMEALRQQIRERRGFICPYYGASAECACGPLMREGIAHLYDLGRAGLFGRGDWFRPPCGGGT